LKRWQRTGPSTCRGAHRSRIHDCFSARLRGHIPENPSGLDNPGCPIRETALQSRDYEDVCREGYFGGCGGFRALGTRPGPASQNGQAPLHDKWRRDETRIRLDRREVPVIDRALDDRRLARERAARVEALRVGWIWGSRTSTRPKCMATGARGTTRRSFAERRGMSVPGRQSAALKRQATRDACALASGSLARLGTDHLDPLPSALGGQLSAGAIHSAPWSASPNEGQIRFAGVSNFDVRQVEPRKPRCATIAGRQPGALPSARPRHRAQADPVLPERRSRWWALALRDTKRSATGFTRAGGCWRKSRNEPAHGAAGHPQLPHAFAGCLYDPKPARPSTRARMRGLGVDAFGGRRWRPRPGVPRARPRRAAGDAVERGLRQRRCERHENGVFLVSRKWRGSECWRTSD